MGNLKEKSENITPFVTRVCYNTFATKKWSKGVRLFDFPAPGKSKDARTLYGKGKKL